MFRLVSGSSTRSHFLSFLLLHSNSQLANLVSWRAKNASWISTRKWFTAVWIQAFVTRDRMLWKHRHCIAASHRGTDSDTCQITHSWTLSQHNISTLEYKISITEKKPKNCINTCQLSSSDRPSLLAKYCRALNEAWKSTISTLSFQSCSFPTASHIHKEKENANPSCLRHFKPQITRTLLKGTT